MDRNETQMSARIGRLTKFGQLVKLPIEDLSAVGKPPRRSKAATLGLSQRQLGAIKITALDRERLLQFGRARFEAVAGPVTPARRTVARAERVMTGCDLGGFLSLLQ